MSAQYVDECFARGLFGASMLVKDAMLNSVKIGSPLFLLDLTNDTLQGVFQAVSDGIFHVAVFLKLVLFIFKYSNYVFWTAVAEYIEPHAFLKPRGGQSECLFPLQVRTAWI